MLEILEAIAFAAFFSAVGLALFVPIALGAIYVLATRVRAILIHQPAQEIKDGIITVRRPGDHTARMAVSDVTQLETHGGDRAWGSRIFGIRNANVFVEVPPLWSLTDRVPRRRSQVSGRER